MKTYHKIETVYERDMEGSKKLIEGKYRSPFIEFLAGAKWRWTEKIDGTNIRVHWDGHKVEFGGRTDKAQIPKHLMEKLEELFGGETNEQLFEQMFGEKDVILFGEGYGEKIQNGGNYRKGVSFMLFDVMIGDVFLERENVVRVAEAMNIEYVPEIFIGSIDDAVKFVKLNPRSTMGTAMLEGVVGRPYYELKDRLGNRIIVKVKCKDFVGE